MSRTLPHRRYPRPARTKPRATCSATRREVASGVIPSVLTHPVRDSAGDGDNAPPSATGRAAGAALEEPGQRPVPSEHTRFPQSTPASLRAHRPSPRRRHAGVTSPGHAPSRRAAGRGRQRAWGRGLMEGAWPGGGRGVRRRQRHVDGGPLLRGEGVSAALGGLRATERGTRQGPGPRQGAEGAGTAAAQRGRPAERGASSGRGSEGEVGNGGRAPPALLRC